MSPYLLLLPLALLLAVSAALGAALKRRPRLSESQLREARELVALDDRRQLVEAQWPALLALVRQHEAECARYAGRPAAHDLVDLLASDAGAELPAIVRAVRPLRLDDFSGGPSDVTGPRGKVSR